MKLQQNKYHCLCCTRKAKQVAWLKPMICSSFFCTDKIFDCYNCRKLKEAFPDAIEEQKYYLSTQKGEKEIK